MSQQQECSQMANKTRSVHLVLCRAEIKSADKRNARTQERPSFKKLNSCNFSNIYYTNL